MRFPDHSADLTAADLFDRYLANELSVEDRLRFEQRLTHEPELAAALARLQAPLDGAASLTNDNTVNLDAAWGRQRWQMQQTWALSTPITRRPDVAKRGALSGTRFPARKWWTPSAATVGLGTAIVAVVAFGFGWRRHDQPAAAQTYLTYTTSNSQRATITLPGGASAVLNAASRLDVPADYAAGNHRVQLHGEALFTVAHRTGTPFTVVANGQSVRVLGTSFVVRDYDTDSALTVAVREGKVAVQSAVVTAGQQVVIDATGNAERRPATPGQFAFASGTLVLDNVPMRAAIAELDRWYDVDIRLGNPTLEHVRVKGEFAAGSRAELKVILEMAFGVRAVSAGRVLTLYPR
jgi:transmembrane sensor